MKFYTFSLSATEAESMWDFAQNNQVNFKYIKQTETDPNMGLLESALKRRYIYGGFMSKETYLMFKLKVPLLQLDEDIP